MSQRGNALLCTLVYGYIVQFQRQNQLFHNFDNVLIDLCILYCINQLKADDFEQIRKIGRGALASIYESKKIDTGKLYAMKKLNKQKLMIKDSFDSYKIMCERNILAAMHSKFIVTLHYAFMDDRYCYLILELMNGADLKYHLHEEGVFTEERTKFYAAEILLGLEHMHNKGIIWRDVKLENILLNHHGHCKISDFDLSVQTNNEKVRGYAGTPGYAAPEVVLGLLYDNIIDYFSFGVLIYRCLCGRKPFPRGTSGTTASMERRVIESEPAFYANYFAADIVSILKGLLRKNWKERLGANGVIEIKQHPWFDSIDFDLLEEGYLTPPFIPNVDDIEYNVRDDIEEPVVDDVDFPSDLDDKLINFVYPENVLISRDFDDNYDNDRCFKPGDIVKIFNLTQSDQFNEETAEVVGYFLEDTQRWPVQIIRNDIKLAIKTENLKLILSYPYRIDSQYEYYDKLKIYDYDKFEIKVFFIMSKWIKLISITNGINIEKQYDVNHYDYIFDNDFIKTIKLFLGKYITFYHELFKLFEIDNDINDTVRGIKYNSSQWTLKLFIDDNKCLYQNNNGIWNIDGNELFIEYLNNDYKTITKTFYLSIFNGVDIFFEHIFC